MQVISYKVDLIQLGNAITDQTLDENAEAVQLLAVNLNCLYGMMLSREGSWSDVFPVTSPERAVRFMISVYSLGAFQFASSIVDHLLTGEYSEASALLRSLIELAAFAEYYVLSPAAAFSAAQDDRSLPTRATVFRKLSKEGRWPVGGPRDTFELYNGPAHAHIAYVLHHTTIIEDGPPIVSRFWLRRYNRDSFRRLARHTLMPLFGLQELYRNEFFPRPDEIDVQPWGIYWKSGHDREAIAKTFPTIVVGTPDASTESTEAA